MGSWGIGVGRYRSLLIQAKAVLSENLYAIVALALFHLKILLRSPRVVHSLSHLCFLFLPELARYFKQALMLLLQIELLSAFNVLKAW